GCATCALKHPDYLSFIIGDSELVERANPASKNNNHVRRSNVDHVSPLQTEARINDHIGPVIRERVSRNVFLSRRRRRDPDGQTSVSSSSSRSDVRKTRRCTRH